MEKPLAESIDLFVGKTILRMDASCCNNVEFVFTDGTRVAIHADCDSNGLPDLLACTHCVELT